MGMYTELHYNVELVSDVPAEVVAVLEYMTNGALEDAPPPVPDHALFSCSRWRVMLQCDSYSFPADTHSTLRFDEIANGWFLCVRCNLKNYDTEIENFVHWLDPFVAAHAGDFLGFSRYETTEDPTLIRKANQSQTKGA